MILEEVANLLLGYLAPVDLLQHLDAIALDCILFDDKLAILQATVTIVFAWAWLDQVF
jgi:hypothetical protein